VNPLASLGPKLASLLERIDRRSLRERGLLFGSGVVLVYVVWQALLMDPVTRRAVGAEQRLAEVRRRGQAADEAGLAASQDPAVAAGARNRALRTRLAGLDAELAQAAQGYASPERMTELLRELIAGQQGLRLVSLRNLPVESLAPPAATAARAAAPGSDPAQAIASTPPDPGPFLHPVEVVVEGDYLSVVNYVHALERLPWRIHWQRLELVAGDYPSNRVRIVLGALSLSRDWMSV
jgi:MSHA biogenesis protein MshJ